MMTLKRRGSAKQKHTARLAWLQPDYRDWADVPGIHDDVTPAGRAALDELVWLMHTLDLFGASQTTEKQRETVRRLLSELRGEHVGGAGW